MYLQLGVTLSLLCLCVTEICDHLKYQYYHRQAKFCKDCDVCIVGEGKIPYHKGLDLKFGPHGATRCIPCRSCPRGWYSDKRSNDCERCTDCFGQGLEEVHACTYWQDAECGAVRSPVIRTDNLGTKAPVNELPKGKTDDTPRQRNGLIGAAVGGVGTLCLISIVLLIAYFIYRITRNRRQRGANMPCERVDYVPVPSNFDTQEDADRSTNSIGNADSRQQSATHNSLTTINEELDPLSSNHALSRDADTHHKTRHYKPKKEQTPLLPKRRRHHSCSTDYGTSHAYDNIAGDMSKKDNSDVEVAKQGSKPRFGRQMSFPMSVKQSSQLIDRVINDSDTIPSRQFCSYLSKLAVDDELYTIVAKHNGMTEEEIKVIFQQYSIKGQREMIYNIFIALMNRNVTKKSIYESLRKFDRNDLVDLLQTYDRKLHFDQQHS